MASKSTLQASTALLLSLNILFFSLVSGCSSCRGPTPKPPPLPLPPPCPPSTTPTNPSPPSTAAKCPTDTVKLGVCANVLNGLINLELGTPPKKPCCSLLQGLADVEAAVCLCTVLRANVLGLINLSLPVNLSLLLNYCGKGTPSGFVCP